MTTGQMQAVGNRGKGLYSQQEQLGRRRRVLLVEDDERIRELMAMLLQSEGFETIELADGIEALSFLAATEVYRGEVAPLDLIIADIMMPTYSGLDMLMGMKEVEDRPPVMLVTGVLDEEIHREGKRLGAACVISKPFDVDKLLDSVHLCMNDAKHGVGQGEFFDA